MRNIFVTVAQEGLVDIKLLNVGQTFSLPEISIGPLQKDSSTFHFIQSGSGQVEITQSDGKKELFSLKAGQGFLCAPYQRYSYVSDPITPWTYFWVEVDGIQVYKLFGRAGLTIDSPIFTIKNLVMQKELEKLFSLIIQAAPNDNFRAIGYTYVLLDFLAKSTQHKIPLQRNLQIDNYVRNVTTFVENHYGEGISVQDIADYCLLNKNYLTKIFKKATNKGLQEFLIDFRLQRSIDFLENSNLPIGTISRTIGYTNQFQFSKAFQKKYNMSPTQWRKLHTTLKKE